MKNNWKLYILECIDGSFYTGITTDLDKRMKKHAEGKGSKYVYSRGFKRLIAHRNFDSRSSASKAEYEVKNLKREEKLAWFNN